MKKNIKRFLSLLLTVSVTCSMFLVTGQFFTVSAKDVSGETYCIEFPRGNDPNRKYWGHGNLKYMSGWKNEKSNQMMLFSIGSWNGNTCYCIEPGVPINTHQTVHSKGDDYWDDFPSNQTIKGRTIQKLIGRILQYGYTGKNNTNWISTDPVGSDKLANIIATQVLIHEVIVGERREDFSKVNAHDYGCNNVLESVLPQHPLRNKIMNHYSRIEQEVKQHTITPEFGGSVFDLQYDGSKYTATLTDQNNVLSKFDFSSSANLTFQRKGNKLTISTKTPPTGNISFTANKRESNRKALVVWTDNIVSPSNKQIQDTVTYGATVSDPVNRSYTLKVTTGNVKLVKESEDGYVANRTFHVKGAGLNTNVVTDKNGEIFLQGLKGGEKLTFTETNVDDRYVVPASQTITVQTGRTTTVRFNNILKRGAAIFKKTDLDTNKEIESKDGIFKIQQWSKAKQEYIPCSDMVYDDAKGGYVNTKDLVVTVDNEGKFRWVEEVAPTGYIHPVKDKEDFTITENGQLYHVGSGVVTNTSQKGKIGILKTGEVLDSFDFMQTEFGMKYSPVYTSKSLSNAVYEVYAMEDIYQNGDLKYHKDELVDTVTTNEDEYVFTKDLYIGDNGSKFLVREVLAPEHFFIGSNEYEVELTYQGQSVEVVTKQIESFNERQKAKVTVQKDIEENPHYPNADAWKDIIFGVFSAEDIKDENGEVILKKDSLVDCFGINEQGQGISSVDFPPETSWYVKELQTADGLVLNTEHYPFSFMADDSKIPLHWIDINETIENKTVKGFVEFKKISAHDGKPLVATYGVYRASDDFLIEQKESSLTDWVRFSELPKGEYYLKEIIPPNHYHGDPTKYPFFIGANNTDGVTIQIIVKNEPIIGSITPQYYEKGGFEDGHHTPQIPNTGMVLNNKITAKFTALSVAVTLTAFSIPFALKRKNNRKK